MSYLKDVASLRQYVIENKLLTVIGEYHKIQTNEPTLDYTTITKIITQLPGKIGLEFDPKLEIAQVDLLSSNIMEIIKESKFHKRIIGFDIRPEFIQWFKIYAEDSLDIITPNNLLDVNKSPIYLVKIPTYNPNDYSKDIIKMFKKIEEILQLGLLSLKNDIEKFKSADKKNLTFNALGEPKIIENLKIFFMHLTDYYLLIQILKNNKQDWIILIGENHANNLQSNFYKYLNISPSFTASKLVLKNNDIVNIKKGTTDQNLKYYLKK